MTRKEAIRELEFILIGHPETSARGKAVLMAIEALKQPERKKGKWINKGSYCVCSLCQHTEPPQYDGVQPIPNCTPYCSMCGAEMEGEE